MFKNSIRNALGAACLSFLGVCAHAQSGTFVTDPFSNTATTSFNWYVDFAANTLASHYSEPTFTFTGTPAPVKYHSLQLTGYSPGAAVCYDIGTGHPEFVPGAVVADTRIWYFNPNTQTWMVLNDDIAPGNLYSRGMVYLSGQLTNLVLRVASFTNIQSETYMLAHFQIGLLRQTNKTEAQCTTGNGGVPWVKYKDGVITHS